jgi:hypothetical protein
MWLSLLIPGVLILAGNVPFLRFLLFHRPAVDLTSLAAAPLHLLAALAAGVACVGIGAGVRRLLGAGRDQAPVSLDFAFGVGALSFILFFTAACGLLAEPACILLLALGWVGFIVGLRRGAWTPFAGSPHRSPHVLAAAAYGFVAWIAWHSFVTALAPPTGWDALAYHLPLAKETALRHRLPDFPWMLHAHFPGGFELVYAWLLTLFDDRLPALLNALCGLAAAHLAFEMFREEGSPEAAWTAAVLYLAVPAFAENAGEAGNDLAMGLMVQASLYAFQRWHREDCRWGVLAAGAAAGVAAAFKLHGLYWGLLLGAAVWFQAPSGRTRALATYALAFLAAAGPWYVRNAWVFGNPVWPFAFSLFGGRDWSAAAEGRIFEGNLWTWAQLAANRPFAVIYFASLVVIALFLSRRFLSRTRALVFVPLLYALPILLHHEFRRFLLPVLPELCWVIALAAVRFSKPSPPRFALACAALVPLLLPALSVGQNRALYAVCGIRSVRFPAAGAREAYLLNALDVYPAQEWVNAHLPPDARVLLFREIRGYYLDRDYLWGDPRNQGLIDYYGFAGPSGLARRLKELGVTHVFVNEEVGIYAPRPGYYEPRFVAWMSALLRAHGTVLYRDGGVSVFRLDF